MHTRAVHGWRLWRPMSATPLDLPAQAGGCLCDETEQGIEVKGLFEDGSGDAVEGRCYVGSQALVGGGHEDVGVAS